MGGERDKNENRAKHFSLSSLTVLLYEGGGGKGRAGAKGEQGQRASRGKGRSSRGKGRAGAKGRGGAKGERGKFEFCDYYV